jgi:hypothetical protein
MTLYKAFYGAKPDISNLCIFGSLVYIYIPKKIASWHKYMAKAFRSIFTSYSNSRY